MYVSNVRGRSNKIYRITVRILSTRMMMIIHKMEKLMKRMLFLGQSVINSGCTENQAVILRKAVFDPESFVFH